MSDASETGSEKAREEWRRFALGNFELLHRATIHPGQDEVQGELAVTACGLRIRSRAFAAEPAPAGERCLSCERVLAARRKKTA